MRSLENIKHNRPSARRGLETRLIYLFIYLSSAKNILHKARKRHNINKYRNTGRGDATAYANYSAPAQ